MLTYTGPPQFASAAAQMLREEGLDVDYLPPSETRGAVELVGFGVTVGLTVRYVGVGIDALVARAAARYRELMRGRGELTLDDWHAPDEG